MYKNLIAELEASKEDYGRYKFQSKAAVVCLRCLIEKFNEDLISSNIPPANLRWDYSNGKTLGIKDGPEFVNDFNKAFSEWRETTGCEANFFAHTREGKMLERLEILDITNSLYSNTDLDEGVFQTMMDDAAGEASKPKS